MKIKLVYLLCIFSLFSILGFVLANRIGAVFTPAKPVQAASFYSPTANLDLNQKKLLIVTVDDLTSTSPQLASVWVGIVMEGNPPSITWKAIYPSPSKKAFGLSLVENFSLNEQKELTYEFLDYLSSNEIYFDGYLVSDYFALGKIKESMNIQEIEINPQTTDTPDQMQIVLAQQAAFISEACNAMGSSIQALPVAELIPLHLHFEMEANVMMKVLNQLSAKASQLRCEIVPLE